MRFLVDAQLPPSLAQFLRESGQEAEHVHDIGLATATDESVWNRAVEKQAVIITKDEDFATMLAFDSRAAVIWVRMGNCSNLVLLEKLKPLLHGIVQRLQQGEKLIEII